MKKFQSTDLLDPQENKFNLEDSSYLRMRLAYRVHLGRVEKNYPIKFEQLVFGKQIGETAFGRMYEGIYRLRPVVIKQYPSNEKTKYTFLKEAIIMAATFDLRGSFLRLKGIEIEKNDYYTLVMECRHRANIMKYRHLADLVQFLKKEGPKLSWKMRYQIGADISGNLDRLHQYGIMHRDLTSNNVLIDVDFRANIINFEQSSLNKRLVITHNEITLDERMGTHSKLTEATDVYSLGKVLLQLITQEIPIDNIDIPNDTPEAFKNIILDCLKEKPDERPAAAEVAERLEALWRAEPEDKKPSTSSELKSLLFNPPYHVIENYSINFEDLTFGEIIRENASSTVYQGIYQFEPVTIKRYDPSNEQTKYQFLKEATIMAAVPPNYFVRLEGIVFEENENKNNYALVMESMPRGNLVQFLKKEGPKLTWKMRYQIGADISYGLDRLHQFGILHRDLTSNNVLIGAGLQAKIMNFEHSIVNNSLIVRTKHWIEMVRDPTEMHSKLREAADVYSLGKVLLQLITLGIPINNINIPKDTPEAFKNIILDCLKKKPEERPAAAEVARRLHALWYQEPSKLSGLTLVFSPFRQMKQNYPIEFQYLDYYCGLIGKTAFSRMFKGIYRSSTTVTIKRYDPSNEQAKYTFLKEATIMAALSSNFVNYFVRLIGIVFEERDDYCALVIEDRNYENLVQFLEKRGPILSYKMRYQIGVDISEGLAYLHQHGIVHRDLTSDNVLIDSHFRAKIRNFEQSSLKNPLSITNKEVKGDGREILPKLTEAADVYSLGKVLLQLITQEIPIDNRDIPKDTLEAFKNIILDCVKEKPDERPAAAEVAKRLQALWRAEPEDKEPSTSSELKSLLFNPPCHVIQNYSINFKDLTFGKIIGKSVFSMVYKGKYQFEPVTIKRYDRSNEQTKYQFLKEATIMAAVPASYFVRLEGIVFEENNYALVMEYMPRGNLVQFLKKGPKLTWERRYQIGADISHGLDCLHQFGILHLDLTSNNVLIDSDFRAKIIDFDVSHFKNSFACKTAILKESAWAWTAPEMRRLKPKPIPKPTEAADVYCLGKLLWYLITQEILIGDISFPQNTPEVFKTIILDCLKKKPKERPAAAEVASRLDVLWRAEQEDKKPSTSSEQKLSGNSQILMCAPKPELKREDQGSLNQLLEFVVAGNLVKAEEMLKAKPGSFLLLHHGDVKDLSGREFKQVTAFQLALWAVDCHMWRMIQKYLPREFQVQQWRELEDKGTEHGKYFNLQEEWIDIVDLYLSNDAAIDADECYKCMIGLEKELPAHVINEYYRRDRSFYPCPLEWEKPPEINSEMHPLSFAGIFVRSNYNQPTQLGKENLKSIWSHLTQDKIALKSLWRTRTQQLELLQIEFSAIPNPSQTLNNS